MPSSISDAAPSAFPEVVARPLGSPSPVAAASRVSTLWEAIRRTREALELRQARVTRLTDRFAATIRPREETFTRTVCRLTERLLSHHEHTTLDVAERALLALWIDENLRSLASHPFAPRAETEALTRRWRGHLGRAAHPPDAARRGTDTEASEDGGAERHGSDPPGNDGPEGADRSDGDAEPGAGGEESGRARNARAGRRTGSSSRPSRGDEGEAGGSGEGGDGGRRSDEGWTREADAGTIERDMRVLSARLFRRLARALHPDREQDETLKRDKHRLMSDCLRARDERDIDTLLSLYVTHVGALPDALAAGGTDALERLLRAQLHDLQRRLRRARGGDALQAMIVDRYAVDDPRESERRFGEHAGALDDETARAESTIRRVAEPEGLHAALDERRAKELDRLWIDEVTGALP